MRRQLFSLFCLLCLSIPVTAQLVDYRALGPNAFYTNGFIVNSKHWTNSVGTLTTPTNYNLFLDHFAVTDTTAALFSIDPTGAASSDNSYGLAGYNSMFPNAGVGVINNINGQVGMAGGAVLYNGSVKTNGEAAGLVGLTESAYSLGIGTVGTSLGLATTTNIGVVGSSQGTGTNVGGYFEVRSTKSAASRLFESAGLMSDSTDTVFPPLLNRVNGTNSFQVTPQGGLLIGLGDQGWMSNAIAAADNNVGIGGISRWGGISGGSFFGAVNCSPVTYEGGFAMGRFHSATNCYIDSEDGSFGGADFGSAKDAFIALVGGSFGGGQLAQSKNTSGFTGNAGSFSIGNLTGASSARVRADDGSVAGANLQNADFIRVTVGTGVGGGSFVGINASEGNNIIYNVENGFAFLGAPAKTNIDLSINNSLVIATPSNNYTNVFDSVLGIVGLDQKFSGWTTNGFFSRSNQYVMPLTNGGSSQVLTTDGGSPQQLYWTTPNSGGITNSGVGPGTVNFIPKFITSTNITDSRVHQVETNQWNWNVRTNYSANTNSWTNRFYAEFTSTNNFQAADFVVNYPNANLYNGIFPVRGSGNTTVQNKFRLWDSWDVNGIGSGSAPDSAGDWLPVVDNAENIGNGGKRVRDYFGSRYVIVTPLSSAAQFTFAAGGGGVGGTTDGTMLQFFRDTGITAAFNKANGAFTFDLAGNGIGFGSGISNVISGLTGSGLAGLVMMSPGTNSATVTPGTHGIIGVMATGADKSGGDLRLVGGSSTGVGTNGSVRIQTSEPALSTSSSLNNNFYDRIYVCAKPKVLTTNSATIVFNVTIPTADRMLGGEVTATTKISDGVDQASVRERFAFTAIRKGSTVTTSISASAPMATLATGSAVLTTTWTAVANAQSVDIKCNAVTSGILSTNTFTRWSVELDSDAVPVISP